ncbi:helix-turn-helix domain-containing protein [Kibdelosporangium phytohabitans]|uniref:helix-turn-helix domain-containing protein n=1 Tax=Kibdelosporangium phytohabitans TaxID=860235 RepID=UPI000AE6CD08|nr:XRE family transcriptional regulator [Kibdelosporangium phytohabitans]MBE1464629.1 transcriptional regulator with XRE-family HTH domain [Kibdelosporangium phytohabitans]
MTTVHRWTGRETKALRQAMRLSIRDFAEVLDVGARTVARWESRGPDIVLTPDSQGLLDTAFARAPDDVRQRFLALLPPEKPVQESGNPQSVRIPVIVNHGLAVGERSASWTALDQQEQQRLAAALKEPRRNLDVEVIGYFNRQLSVHMADDGTAGPAKPLPAVLELAAAVQQAARDVSPRVRRELLAVSARVAEFLAWLYRDVCEPVSAGFWRDRATEWAQEAGDSAMQGYVLLKRAQAAYDERDALRMLTLSQAVRTGPWCLPTKVKAEAAQQEARGHAMLGHHHDLVDRNLDEARQLLEGAGASSAVPEETGAHYNSELLRIQTAICRTEAGQPGRAVELYQRSLQTNQFSQRDRGYFSSLMASALALAGEPDEAAGVALAAWPLAVRTDSGRTTAELKKVLVALQPWRARATVREFQRMVLEQPATRTSASPRPSG